jgi:putative transposase
MDTELFHIFNRGVDKRKIFMDKKDYYRAIHDLYEFNDVVNVNPNTGRVFDTFEIKASLHRNWDRKPLVNIHAFCLMPNHYHILISPVVEKGISLFMKKLNGGYAKYFNERHKRSGALFQGKYKSVPILGDPHFSYITHYIHFNPLDLSGHKWRQNKLLRNDISVALSYLQKYRWSSHLDYLGIKNVPSVTERGLMLDFFNGTKGYEKYTKNLLQDFNLDSLKGATIE